MSKKKKPILNEHEKYLEVLKELKPEYREYLQKREGEVKPRTLYLLSRVFRTFPAPDKINGDYFRSLKLASSTLQHYITTAKHFLKWSGLSKEEIDKRIDFKPLKQNHKITANDLYNADDLDKIISATMNTRDRAMIETLYDTATRARELLSMNVESIEWTDDGGVYIPVNGKTGPRRVLVFSCVPALRAWINVHPTGKGPVWVSMQEPFAPIKYAGLYRLVELCVKRAGVKGKKRILHLMRHTRATEQVRDGLRGPALCDFMGWEIGSSMEQIYVHLSAVDVDNAVRRAAGKTARETEVKRLLTKQICSNCETENSQSAYVCVECGQPLSKDKILSDRLEYLEEKLERLSRFQDSIGEKMLVNVGTKEEPKYIEVYAVEKKEG